MSSFSTNTDVSTEVQFLYFRKERNFTSESKETELLEVKEIDPNYNNTNYNNQNYIDVSYINPINQSVGNMDKPRTQKKVDTIDMIDETYTYIELIRDNLEYVMGCMRDTVEKITNIRAYLITALYNAPGNHKPLLSAGGTA